MTYLLDVNILVALLDADHEHHLPARAWFEKLTDFWATCPLTEMGVSRILSSPAYPKGLPTPGDVVLEVRRLQHFGRHEFWTDDLALVSSSRFELNMLHRPKQVTDSYLLALAVLHQGRLATFDRRLDARAVQGGAAALFQVPA